MSRTGISYAIYGHGVKMKQNKQPFRTEDDIEARSDDIYECNIPVRVFPGWFQHMYRGTGFDAHTSFTFPLPLGTEYNPRLPYERETPCR